MSFAISIWKTMMMRDPNTIKLKNSRKMKVIRQKRKRHGIISSFRVHL